MIICIILKNEFFILKLLYLKNFAKKTTKTNPMVFTDKTPLLVIATESIRFPVQVELFYVNT